MRFFLLFLLLFPVLELFVLIRVGMSIGFLATFLLLVAGSLLGIFVIRVAGLATALRTRESLARGELPAGEMLDGLMMVVGGGLLLLPGFISDVLGLLMLMPFSRRFVADKVRRRAEDQALRQRAFADDPAHGAAREGARQPNVIEGEFEHRDH